MKTFEEFLNESTDFEKHAKAALNHAAKADKAYEKRDYDAVGKHQNAMKKSLQNHKKAAMAHAKANGTSANETASIHHETQVKNHPLHGKSQTNAVYQAHNHLANNHTSARFSR